MTSTRRPKLTFTTGSGAAGLKKKATTTQGAPPWRKSAESPMKRHTQPPQKTRKPARECTRALMAAGSGLPVQRTSQTGNRLKGSRKAPQCLPGGPILERLDSLGRRCSPAAFPLSDFILQKRLLGSACGKLPVLYIYVFISLLKNRCERPIRKQAKIRAIPLSHSFHGGYRLHF